MVLRLPDSWSNWNLEVLVFGERGKPEYPEKNLSEQGREPTTQPTYGVDAGILTRATLVGGERSHHSAIPCSPIVIVYSINHVRSVITGKSQIEAFRFPCNDRTDEVNKLFTSASSFWMVKCCEQRVYQDHIS